MPEAEDAQLEIKKRARRRLVGAIALSLFAATIFPLVMDHDPGPMVQDIEIKIPGEDDRTLNNRLALQPPPDDAPAAPVANTAPTPTAESAKPAETSSAATTSSESPTIAITQAAPSAVAVEVKAPAEKPAVAVVETKRAQDILNAKTASVSEKPQAHQGQFVILIGAFSNEGNVKVLRNKMTEAGIKSFTEPFGDKTRVRAGPFPSREAADKALHKMKAMGVNGQIASK